MPPSVAAPAMVGMSRDTRIQSSIQPGSKLSASLTICPKPEIRVPQAKDLCHGDLVLLPGELAMQNHAREPHSLGPGHFALEPPPVWLWLSASSSGPSSPRERFSGRKHAAG